jgi:hypothetical protein
MKRRVTGALSPELAAFQRQIHTRRIADSAIIIQSTNIRGDPTKRELNGMAQKTELWLVRHGETEWSISGQHTGTSDIPLTERGRERAKGIRDYLQHRAFKKVFVSPLGRARETCGIAGYGDQAVVDPNLTEWNTATLRAKPRRKFVRSIRIGSSGTARCRMARQWSR